MWVLQPAFLAAYQTKAAEKDDTSELRRVFPEMGGAGMLEIRLRNMVEGVFGATSGSRKQGTQDQCPTSVLHSHYNVARKECASAAQCLAASMKGLKRTPTRFDLKLNMYLYSC